MRTTELFKFNRSSKRLNESLEKTFGNRIDFASFDTPKLEDARNKLRTQISQVRGQSGFNEDLDNEAYTKAQWMHDAIVAELADREEHIVDTTVEEDVLGENYAEDLAQQVFDHNPNLDSSGRADDLLNVAYSIAKSDLGSRAQGIFRDEDFPSDFVSAYAHLQKGGEESMAMEKAPEGWEGTVKAMKKHKEIDNPYALAHFMKNKGYKSHKEESVETGDDMTRLQEGEIQQASAIVTAKTMVDRVGRWIEELSGMENDTLLQLGDSIRDEMGQEQAKSFIEAVAPAIQQALENLKTTRETLASGVRTLTGEEQAAGMLGAEPEMGAEPGADMAAEPDAMNAEPGAELGGEGDAFDAAEPSAGGAEEAGREQRESIQRSNRLMKILAG